MLLLITGGGGGHWRVLVRCQFVARPGWDGWVQPKRSKLGRGNARAKGDGRMRRWGLEWIELGGCKVANAREKQNGTCFDFMMGASCATLVAVSLARLFCTS